MSIHVDAVNAYSHSGAKLELPPAAAADQGVPAFVEVIEVVGQCRHRNQTFDKKIIQFDEEAEIPYVDDHPGELFAQTFGHEDGFAPLVKLIFGGVRGSFALAGFF